ncbi:MAG: translocation/assembly module TamB domain-containing protein [Gammaproteobacteria bacterium]|nr:translocation/assembly module TamB domain-containing protein [Gammaproteobacteria bacterium]
MRVGLRIAILSLAALVGLVAVLAALLAFAGNTSRGRRGLESLTRVLTLDRVEISGLGGAFPAHLTAGQVRLRDRGGVWLTANAVVLDWDPLALLRYEVRVDDLRVRQIDVVRRPQRSVSRRRVLSTPRIVLRNAAVERLVLGPGLVGRPATLTVRGTFRMESTRRWRTQAQAIRTDAPGRYAIGLVVDPAEVRARVSVVEPAGGPLETLLGLPTLGGGSAEIALDGPRAAERLRLRIDAGALHASARGTVDWAARSAQIRYAIDAVAMRPRPDLGWQRLAASGTWRGGLDDAAATGSIDVDGLRLGHSVSVGAVRGTLTGTAGRLTLRGSIADLRVGGPRPALFAGSPIAFEARLLPKPAAQRLQVRVDHPLFAVHATLGLGARFQADADIDVPQIEPFAALAGRTWRGRTDFQVHLRRGAAGLGFTIDGRASALASPTRGLAALGDRLRIGLEGTAGATAIVVSRLQVAGRDWALGATGNAVRRRAPSPGPAAASGLGAWIESLHAQWHLAGPSLADFSSGLAGTLTGSGRIAGPWSRLVADAQFTSHLSVRGALPGTIDARLRANLTPGGGGEVRITGQLGTAPIDAIAVWRRRAAGTTQVEVRRAEWKSARLGAQFTLDRRGAVTAGQAQLGVADLGDFAPLAARPLAGGLVATGRLTSVDGHARAEISARLQQARYGAIEADAEIRANGSLRALGVQVDAQLPQVAGGPVHLAAAGQWNLAARTLRIDAGTLRYRGETATLRKPTRVSYAEGLSVDALDLALGRAHFDLSGQLAPTLAVKAELAGETPALVDWILPGFLARGTIDARADLQGRLTAPRGTVHWDARGMRAADDQALGLPAVDFRGDATLDGASAQVDGRVAAGRKAALTVTGRVPLRAEGRLDLSIDGAMDLGLAAPTLEARGIYLAGSMRIAAGVTGTLRAPLLAGRVEVKGAHLRDYGRGLNLENVDATLVGDGDALSIEKFTGSMPPGTVSMTGRIGVLRPGIPVDLRIVATHARPIASNLITTDVDADVRVTGTARERLEVAGRIQVHRALIGIPNALPPNVAVLAVRRPGERPPSATQPVIIALDLNVDAPRQVLVRGRGLDAELGGDVHLGGTVDAPVATGGFDLQRGRFDLAGTKLSFTSGRVGFTGSGLRHRIDPSLDFVAQTSSGGVQTTLRITGLADAPRFVLTSVPAMPPDQILSNLLFGGTHPAQISALQAAQVGAALATLSGVGGGDLNPLSWLQRALGLDRLTIGTAPAAAPAGGAGATRTGATIAAGRYLTSRVYVEAKQTTTGSSQLQVNVDLTRHLKLQTRFGTGAAILPGTTPENDPGSSIGLSYQIEY